MALRYRKIFGIDLDALNENSAHSIRLYSLNERRSSLASFIVKSQLDAEQEPADRRREM
jgi:hypothetical protein